MGKSISKIEIIDGKIHWEIEYAFFYAYEGFRSYTDAHNWMIKNSINPEKYLCVTLCVDEGLIAKDIVERKYPGDYNLKFSEVLDNVTDISLYRNTAKENKDLVEFRINSFNQIEIKNLFNPFGQRPTGAYLIKNAIIFKWGYSFSGGEDWPHRWFELLVPKYDGSERKLRDKNDQS